MDRSAASAWPRRPARSARSTRGLHSTSAAALAALERGWIGREARALAAPGRIGRKGIPLRRARAFSRTGAWSGTRSLRPRLADRAAHEGRASFVALELGQLGDEDALFWGAAELGAARAARAELLAAFRAAADSTDASVIRSWTTLGATPAGVDGAPARSAYYLGLEAARAWRERHAEAPLAELLALDADTLLDGLE
jgi:hypothetical protein